MSHTSMQPQVKMKPPPIEQQAEVIVYEDYDRHGPYTRLYCFIGGFAEQDIQQIFSRLELQTHSHIRAISLEEFNQLQEQEGRLRFSVERAISISRKTFKTISAALKVLPMHQTSQFAVFRDNREIGFALHHFYIRMDEGRNMTCYKVIACKSVSLDQLKALCIKTKKQLEVFA